MTRFIYLAKYKIPANMEFSPHARFFKHSTSIRFGLSMGFGDWIFERNIV